MENMKEKINAINRSGIKVNIMEVCGTHTAAISRFGLRSLLSSNVNLISGPGCPVCVTPDMYIDYIYDLSLKKDIIIATYGDMIRVPGSNPKRTLEYAMALGANVKMVYSSIDALEIARNNPYKKVVFLGIGFETTSPHTAAALKESIENGINNFYVLSMHKRIEPVMRALLEDKELKIDGFLCPGHVAAIIGVKGFEFLDEYKCNGVITGFEFDEIVNAVYMLVKNIKNGDFRLLNCYDSLVKYEGNLKAISIIDEVFEMKEDYWRGMGKIPGSGLKLRSRFKDHDIEMLYPIDKNAVCSNDNGCQCGDVLKGKIKPSECRLFKKVCTPENPVGPCMVSAEGSCAAYYKYI